MWACWAKENGRMPCLATEAVNEAWGESDSKTLSEHWWMISAAYLPFASYNSTPSPSPPCFLLLWTDLYRQHQQGCHNLWFPVSWVNGSFIWQKTKKGRKVRSGFFFFFLAPSLLEANFSPSGSSSLLSSQPLVLTNIYTHRKTPSPTRQKQKIPYVPFTFHQSLLASGSHCSVFWYYELVCIL